VRSSGKRKEFERLFMPHLDAAYNLARWLVRHPHDAEDLVQEAYLKAFKSFDTFRGKEPKAWIMAIVRNSCLTWLKRHGNRHKIVDFNEALDQRNMQISHESYVRQPPKPDAALIAEADKKPVHDALRQLPEPLRTIVILREFEDMSYNQIAEVINTPVGTVMSRLSRARKKLRNLFLDQLKSAAAMEQKGEAE
jgi:RNA polymerase sigma-70 factor (ECF subfamily)